MVAKRFIDWDAIERDYRAGVKTLREMSADHHVSHVSIDKHAKKRGWTRDLGEKIKKENLRIEEKERRIKAKEIKSRGKIVLQPDKLDEFDSQGFLYVIYLDDSALERYYKIGMAKNFNSRFNSHQCSSPFDICVAMAYFVGNMRKEENDLHRMFSEKRIKGEWFKLSDDDLKVIANRCLIYG